jgi:hypothetical protein
LTNLEEVSYGVEKIMFLGPNVYMVNWREVCGPKSLGGLGIKELNLFSKALKLRWLLFD